MSKYLAPALFTAVCMLTAVVAWHVNPTLGWLNWLGFAVMAGVAGWLWWRAAHPPCAS